MSQTNLTTLMFKVLDYNSCLPFVDEITESEESTGTSHGSLSLKMKSNCNKKVREKTSCESETESEQDSQYPDFLEKLDDLIKKFKYKTDGAVINTRDSYVIEEQNEQNDVSEHGSADEQGKSFSIRDVNLCVFCHMCKYFIFSIKNIHVYIMCTTHVPRVCLLDVRGSMHHSTICKEKSNKMQQCIKILFFHIYMKLNVFRTTHLPSSGA